MPNDFLMLKRKIVVVLGPGRSGTSLVMHVLRALGLSLSDDLVEPRYHNPEGPMEDLEISTIYDSELLPLVGSNRLLPFPWDQAKNIREINSVQEKLKNVLEKNIIKSPSIWGFKDPVTSSVLPLWFQIFNRAAVVPRFILCTRNPAAVVASRKNSFGNEQSVGELAWLTSTVSALWDSGADLFVLHYEDWFVDPQPLAQALLYYSELDLAFKGNLSDVIENSVKSNLNRVSPELYEIQNPYVKKLYAALKNCHGTDFDRDRLMAVVKECRQAMEEFKGWYQLAHQANKRLADTQGRLEKATAEAARVKTLEARIQALEAEKAQSKQWAGQVHKLERQLEQLLAIKFDNP